jgi:hypothetical protein
MSQLLIHLWGDYILQSDWMATYKTKDSIAAFAHALMYSSFFILLRPSLTAWLVICGTHFLIDRFRLARYVVWAKNWIAPREAWIGPTPRRGLRNDLWERGNTPKYADGSQFVALRRTPPWEACQPTGYRNRNDASMDECVASDNRGQHHAFDYQCVRAEIPVNASGSG